MPLIPQINGRNIALVSVFAALIALATWPPEFTLASGIPVTLQTLAVVLAGLVLGAWRGFAAVLLYVVVGLAGAPIYANAASGWGTFTGATGGYIWSFPIAAFVVGWLVERLRTRSEQLPFGGILAAGLASLPIVYAIGVPWLAHVLEVPVFNPAEEGGPTALAWGMIPFVLGDLLKVVLAAAVAIYLHRAFPQLLAPGAPNFVEAAPTARATQDPGKKSTAKKSVAKKAPAKAGSTK